MMTTEMFSHAVAWGAARGTTEITILGGEPSLHPQFVAFVDRVKEVGLSTRVVTNGAIQFRRAVESGAISTGNVERVAVSLDTLDVDLQDRLRGPKAYEDAMATVEVLRSAGIPFDLNSTATRPVLHRLGALIDFADEMGARRVNVHWPSTIGLGADLDESELPNEEEWLCAVKSVDAYRPRSSDLFVEIERGFLREAPFRGCALDKPDNLQVFPDGRAILCGLGTDRADWPALRLAPTGLEILEGPSVERDLELQVRSGCSSCPAVNEPGRACIYDKVRSDSAANHC